MRRAQIAEDIVLSMLCIKAHRHSRFMFCCGSTTSIPPSCETSFEIIQLPRWFSTNTPTSSPSGPSLPCSMPIITVQMMSPTVGLPLSLLDQLVSRLLHITELKLTRRRLPAGYGARHHFRDGWRYHSRRKDRRHDQEWYHPKSSFQKRCWRPDACVHGMSGRFVCDYTKS